MNVGIIYDLKEDYGIDNRDIGFDDFSSLSEIQGIQEAIMMQGHYAEMIGSPDDFVQQLKSKSLNDYDIIMNFAEGFRSRNREALIPSVCELFKIPYTFSDSHTMSLTLDKNQTLLFAESLGIAVPRGFLFIPEIHHIDMLPEKIREANISFPIVCKPNYEGTSMGITLAHNETELKQAVIQLTDKYSQPIRCDEYISGREIAVPILGTGKDSKVMGIVEYQNLNGTPMEFYTYEYKRHGCHKTIFADYGEEINMRIEDSALLIHKSISCYDLSRIDMRLHNGTPYLLEVTPLPDMTRNATIERCANKNGLTYGELLEKIISSALKRYKGAFSSER